jgi:hypothetical protein
MRCVNCGAEIPPQWVNALQSNVCPGCGGSIMDESSKELLDEISSAMERMPNDPQGLAGWLLSNYELFKIGDGQPIGEFHRKKQPEDYSNLKIAGDPQTKFFERAGVPNANTALAKKTQFKNKKIATLVSNIMNTPDPYGDGSDIEYEDSELDNEDVNAYNEMKKDGTDPFNLNQSSEINIDDKLSGDKIEESLLSTPEGKRVLNTERLRKINAQQAFQNGGGVFRRN